MCLICPPGILSNNPRFRRKKKCRAPVDPERRGSPRGCAANLRSPGGLLRFGTRPEPIVYHRSDAVYCPRRVLCRRLCISSKYAAAAARSVRLEIVASPRGGGARLCVSVTVTWAVFLFCFLGFFFFPAALCAFESIKV
jgi:hypothetical protein